jgi:rhamnosyltransferase
MKIAAVAILYHPQENVLANILSYYDSVDKIFVYDNTETTSLNKDIFLDYPKIEYYHEFKNEGISKRLNDACEAAVREGFSWLLTMDQDSYFSEISISNYFKCVREYAGIERVAICGPQYTTPNVISDECNAKEVDLLITSGCLLNLSLFAVIGKFDEALFIDSVDHDYCIRAKINGFSIIKFSNIYMSHALGHEVFRASIKTLYIARKKKQVHSPTRCYYMYRNLLYLESKYSSLEINTLITIRNSIIYHLKVSMLYGSNPSLIGRYLIKAKSDFKNNRMGKASFKIGAYSHYRSVLSYLFQKL